MKKKKIIIAGIAVVVVVIAVVIGMRFFAGGHRGIDNNPEAEVSGSSNVLVAYFSWSGNGQRSEEHTSELQSQR